PDDFAWGGAVSLDHFADATAGDDGVVLLLDTGVHAQRGCFSNAQYAPGGAIFDIPRSDSILHRDCARSVFDGRGRFGVVATDDGAGAVWCRGDGSERHAVPQEIGLTLPAFQSRRKPSSFHAERRRCVQPSGPRFYRAWS